MKISGIVTAAGLSSRMGDFKPLMEINGFPMIELTVQSLENAGIEDICVVTGHRGGEVEAALKHKNVRFAQNASPEASDMLTSVKLGLCRVLDSDGFFLLPGDMPLVRPKTFSAVINAAGQGLGQMIIPTADGKNAHPPLILKECYDKILGFDGDGGIPAALEGIHKSFVETGDPLSRLDADCKEDISKLRDCAKKVTGIAPKVCEKLYDEAGLLQNIRGHCRAVGELSEHMARTLTRHGYALDITLCRAAGMLHDILRTEKMHSAAGADFLLKCGYDAISDIVRRHMTFDGLSRDFDEYTVVCLADKLISGTKRVSVFERYAPASEKYAPGTEIGARVRRDCAAGFSLYAKYVELTGEALC